MYYWEIRYGYARYYAYGNTFREACENLGFDWCKCNGHIVH